MALTELEQMEKVRDLAGSCVALLTEIRDAEKPYFKDGNEDLEGKWSANDLTRMRNKVDNRKGKIRGIVEDNNWPDAIPLG